MRIFGQVNDLNTPQWKLDIGYVGDFQATLKELKDLGAENIRDIHLGIEEIALQILKGSMKCGN